MAAEAERVRQRRVYTRVASNIRDVIEVALGVRVLIVDGWRQTTAVEDFDTHDRFERAPGAHHVARHTFRGRNGRSRLMAEDCFDGPGLRAVILRSGRAVRVDVADVARLQPR